MPNIVRPGRLPLPGQSATGFKPNPWNVQRRYIAPEWQWAWEEPVLASAFWSGSGPIRDVVRGRTAPLTSATWASGKYGQEFLTDAQDEHAVFPHDDGLAISNPHTVAYLGRIDQINNFGHRVSKWQHFVIRHWSSAQSGNTGWSYSLWDGGSEVTFSTGTEGTVGDWYLVFGWWDGSTAFIESHNLNDGTVLSNSASVSTMDSNTNDLWLHEYQGDLSNAQVFGAGGMLWVSETTLTSEQRRQFARDLFGPFRPAQQVIVSVPSGGVSQTVGIAAETDSALTSGAAKTVQTGISTETDSGLTTTAEKARQAGIAAETDAGLAAGAGKTLQAGIAAETDSGLAATAAKLLQTGIATETDTGLPATSGNIVAVGIATETDSGLAASGAKTLVVGLASESDAGLVSTADKAYTLGLASETDTGLAATAEQARQAGIATETDTGLSPTAAKALQVAIATETDTALSATVATGVGLFNIAVSVDQPLDLSASIDQPLDLDADVDQPLDMDVDVEPQE